MINWKNSFIFGFIVGLIIPPIAFSIYILISFQERTIWNAVLFYKRGGVLSHVISLSVIANLIPFFLSLNSGNEKTARGVIGGSFIYVFIVLLIILLK